MGARPVNPAPPAVISDEEMGAPPAIISDDEMGAAPAPVAAKAAPSDPGNPLANQARKFLGLNPRARFSFSNLMGDEPVIPPNPQPTGKPPAGGLQSPSDANNPLKDDWIGQNIIGGLVGGAAGRLAGPVLSKLGRAAPAMAGALGKAEPVVAGALDGAVNSKAQGGDALPGAEMGAGLATLGPLGRAVMNSRGGQSRQFIEQRGKGASVGAFSPGTGGVFDNELAGVTSDAAGEGEAAMRGSRGLLTHHEDKWSDATGNPVDDYRRSPGEYKSDIKAREKEAVGPAPAYDEPRATPEAQAKLDQIEAEHGTTKSVYRGVAGNVDSKVPSMPKREITDIVTAMRDSVDSLRTSPASRAKLREYLGILQQHADGEGTVHLSETDLNDLRSNLMREAKIGQNDLRGSAEAPLRKAAFMARDMVNEGPYKDVNAFYTKGSDENVARRKAAGLSAKFPKDRQTDLTRATRKIATDRYNTETADYTKRSAHAADESQAYLDDFESGKNRARKPREQLGLSEDIPSRRNVDEERLKLRLLDREKNTHTAGGKASYKGHEGPSLDEYLAENPEAQGHADLPGLASARNRLSFGLGPHVTDLMSAAHHAVNLASLPGKLRLLYLNRDAVAGRGLYPAAKAVAGGEADKLNPVFQGILAAQERDKKKDKKEHR